MKKINYKCNSCGGKLNVDKTDNTLICTYCNKKYDKFIKIEDFKVDKLIEKLELYTYICHKCGFSFQSVYNEIEKKPICPKCMTETTEEKQIINGIIPNQLIKEYITNDFDGEIKEIKKYIPMEFLNPVFFFKYVPSKVYDGIIEITATGNLNNQISRKYVIFDLIIPDSNTLNYNDKFEFIYNKVRTEDIQVEKQQVLKEISSNNIEINFNKQNNIKNIEKSCLRDFEKKYQNVKDIKINTNVDVKHNIYVPLYQSKTLYNGNCYYNSIVGFKDKNGNGSNFCLNFPKLSEQDYNKVVNTYKKAKIIYYASKILTAPMLILFFIIIALNTHIYIMGIGAFLAITTIALWRIYKRKHIIAKKQALVYLNPNKLSEEDFYDKIVDEKNNIIRYIDWR